ncbi:hypothetical protein B0A54_15468 [Friedmanniomyces endolithicus]|uniref:Uncharacterized protein n=1 Tax=Friedmanniomyces endolithicus TaxID=329885 RepID=A0A4U0UBP9_9PEZI|nr:hypothetical protein B0A54_15468 [Friedmanniomyces endolithicus]
MGLRIVVLPHWKAGGKRCVVLKLPRKINRQSNSANPCVSNKSDINWVIMDYLVSEGYPGAAEKFAQETNLPDRSRGEHDHLSFPSSQMIILVSCTTHIHSPE